MKKLLVLTMVLVSFVSYGQNKTTLGFMGGFGLNSSISANYGGWIDNGKWGVSFTNGASLSNEDPTDYIYGNASKYTAGNSYYNLGVFRNDLFNKNLFGGVGIQRVTDITTNGFEKGTISPYFNAGFKKEIIYGVVRGEVLIGKIPSISLGWGFNF